MCVCACAWVVCVRPCMCVCMCGRGRSSTSLIALYVNLNEAVATCQNHLRFHLYYTRPCLLTPTSSGNKSHRIAVDTDSVAIRATKELLTPTSIPSFSPHLYDRLQYSQPSRHVTLLHGMQFSSFEQVQCLDTNKTNEKFINAVMNQHFQCMFGMQDFMSEIHEMLRSIVV